MRLRIGEPDLLCIDWDERVLRVLNAGFSRGTAFVRNAFAVPIAAGVDVRDVQSMGSFIKRTLSEHRVRTRRAVLDVPRQDAVLTLLNLPKGSTDEIAAMVHMQVGREMPFARDQAVIDFAVAKMEEGAATSEVWAAAVRNNVIDHLRQVLAAAGLRAEHIGLRSYANLLAVQATGELPTRTVTVDVGPSMTEINVIREGRLVFSRAAQVSIPAGGLTAPITAPAAPTSDSTIPFAAEELVPRPRAIDRLLVEVSRTIEAYRATDPGARIDRIILAGSGGITDPAVSAFETRFGVPTQMFTPPASLQWNVPGDVSPALFNAVIGLAISGAVDDLAHFDFLHPKEPLAEHRERVKRVPMMAVAVGLFVATGVVLAYIPIRNRGQQIEQLKSQYQSMNADVKHRDELTKQLADVESWRAKNVVWLDTLRQVASDIYPSNKEAYFDSIEFNESGQVTMKFLAVDNLVGSEMAERAGKIKVPDPVKKAGVSVYGAKTGELVDSQEPKYPKKDQVILQVNSLLPKPVTRR